MEDLSPTPFASPSGINWNGHTGTVQYGKSDGQVVMFYNRSVQDVAKTQEQGRPYFTDKIYVRYFTPGEQRTQINDRPANANDQMRWALQWNQFQQNKAQTVEGTPISVLYPDHPSIEAQCRAAGVYTVEQLAALSAHAIESVGMGAQAWVNYAVKYLEVASKGVSASTMRKELDDRDSKIRVLEQTVDMLKKEISRMSDGKQQAGMDLAQVQAMIAQAMGRPTIPTTPNGQAIPQTFDAQTAQINAGHVTKEVADKKTRRKKNAA
jgi:hypothetical protein